MTQEKDKMTNPLKVYREQIGLSRAELARRSRAAYMTLTTLENGFQLGISGKTAQRCYNADRGMKVIATQLSRAREMRQHRYNADRGMKVIATCFSLLTLAYITVTTRIAE